MVAPSGVKVTSPPLAGTHEGDAVGDLLPAHIEAAVVKGDGVLDDDQSALQFGHVAWIRGFDSARVHKGAANFNDVAAAPVFDDSYNLFIVVGGVDGSPLLRNDRARYEFAVLVDFDLIEGHTAP